MTEALSPMPVKMAIDISLFSFSCELQSETSKGVAKKILIFFFPDEKLQASDSRVE